ncbi:MAG TPA: M23 family metallopeptidase, partial [Solirubrobacteraceae bacterium]|nr:M23 family metallopeptidase [Solirubrobacteraceae bacterium]
FASTGTPLRAPHDAVVLETGSDGGRGNYVVLFAPRVRRTFSYFHMSAAAPVRAGERVRAGRRVGAVGCSGSCQGAHLHLEMHAGRGTRGRALDPLPALRRWARTA